MEHNPLHVPRNLLSIVSQLKSDQITSIGSFHVTEFMSFFETYEGLPEDILAGMPNINSMQISMDKRFFQTENVGEIPRRHLEQIVQMFKERANCTIEFIFHESYHTIKWLNLYTFPYFLRRLQVKNENVNITCSNFSWEKSLFPSDKVIITSLPFKKQDLTLNYKDLREVQVTFYELSDDIEPKRFKSDQFAEKISEANNLKVFQFSVNGFKQSEEEIEVFNKLINSLSKTVEILKLIHLRVPTTIDFSTSLGNKLPNIREMVFDYYNESFLEGKLCSNYFTPFEKMEILYIPCVEEHLFEFNDSLRVVVILKCDNNKYRRQIDHKLHVDQKTNWIEFERDNPGSFTEEELRLQSIEEFQEYRHCKCLELTNKFKHLFNVCSPPMVCDIYDTFCDVYCKDIADFAIFTKSHAQLLSSVDLTSGTIYGT
uniref:FTH domain-containing protein n=1 Tax=Rhabditophanes sp. KR3021 TaxID=114890 RepID=A0AC35TZH7_9BILA